MALPTTTNDVTTRRLGTAISSLWTKIKNTFQTIGNKVTSWSSTPSDTKYPSEKLVKTALDGKSNTGHTHNNIVTEGDNRNVSTIPNDYTNKLVFKGLKTKAAIDNPSNDTYSYLVGLRGWDNSSGGNAHELAFNNTGIFARSGSTTTWGEWEKFLTSNDLSAEARTIPQDISKGANLVVNGSGTMMSNYNFSTCEYLANTDLPTGVAGCFHKAGSTFFDDEKIAVNTSKAYYLESWYRVKTASTSTVRLSIACFDIDGKEIQANTICYGVGTLTKLTQDLNNGDTVVHLEDLSGAGWVNTTEAWQRGFIFWNYKNSLGYQYPPETYSRNVHATKYETANVNVSAGTITLNSAWGGGTIPAGTYVSRYSSGSTYYYVKTSAASGALTTWTKLEGVAKGFNTPGSSDGGPFRPGTAFIKVGWVNANTSGSEWIEFGGIELRELPDSSGKLITARKLKTNLARTADSTFDGSADQTNIPVTGTLPVGNGGTGKASVTANSYLKGNGTGALVERTYAEVRTDLGISAGANKVEASTTNGNIKIDGTDTTVYTHPTQTAYTSKGTATKVPQITTDSTGHVTGITEVTITGVTPASHTHGNIANGGTLTDTAAAAAGNDYVVIRDADNAKIQTSTIKGTDVADAVSKKHSHSTLTLSTTAQAYDGTHTLALPSSDPYTSARTPASHTHGNIANGGTLTDTAAAAAGNDYVVIRDADNAKIQTSTIKGTDVADAVSKKHSHSTLTLSTTAQAYDGTHTLALPASDPYTSARTPASHTHGNIANGGTLTDTAAAAAGNDYVVIRDADNAKIQTSTIKGTDVADAVSKKHDHSTLTLSTTAQAYDGTHTLALPASDPYTSARTPASHTHGNITNAGGITASGVTIANGDSLAIVDSSETNKLIAKSSVTFDGSTTTKALTQKGTFETFLKSHQDISGKEDTSNKVSSWSSTTTDTHYPSEKLVKDSLDEKADKAEGVYYVVGTHQFTAYSASATYTVWTSGAYTASNSCLRDNYAYYCKTAISTPEAWNSSHWTKIATVEWQGAITGLTALYAGLKIAYKVPCYGGSSSTTLNINNLGAKTVMRNVSNTTTHLPTGSVVFLAYDGTYWRWADYDSDTTYTVQAYTSTGASTAAKTATAYGFVYTAGETFLVRFGNGNTYAGAITLNLNSQGAKALYLNGKPTSASNYSFSAGTYPVYYDGTNCYMWTDGTFEHKHVKAVSYKGLEYTNGENLVYQYVSGGSSNCTYPADHSYVTIAPDNRDTYFGIKFAEDVAADEIISAAFDVEYTGDDDGQFKWEFKAIGQQGGIKIAITGAGHYTAYGVAGLAVTKGTLQNAAFDDLGRTLPANSLKIKNFKFERGATATGFCLCKDETSIGHAETADKINTSVKIGDTNQPVYVAADGTVTPISYTIATSVPANAVFTDTKVKATAKTDNVNYKILATASASPTSGNATEAVYDTDITLNPSTNTIAASISGNAATATSAGKLTTARKTYVTLGTASTTTTRDWSGDTTIPVDGTLAVSHGGTGLTSVTSNSFLVGNGTGALVEKTAAQVLSLIGAQAAMTEMTTQEVTDFLTELGDF